MTRISGPKGMKSRLLNKRSLFSPTFVIVLNLSKIPIKYAAGIRAIETVIK